MTRSILVSFVVCSALVLAAGCDMFGDKNKNSAQKMQASQGKTAVANLQPAKAAATQPANQNVTGVVTFTQAGDDVAVVAHVNGLSPGKHGFHVHQKGDLSAPNLSSAGSHYDVGGHKHGGPDSPEHHTGDLGNLTADDTGHAMLEATLHGVKLSDLVGKSVIVHATTDDLKTDPAGNSGGRVAGGVIETK